MNELLTANQLAAALKLTPGTVLEMARQRVIPVVRLSRKAVRFDVRQVQETLERRTQCASN